MVWAVRTTGAARLANAAASSSTHV